MKSKIFDQNWYDKEKSEKISYPDAKDKNEIPSIWCKKSRIYK